MFKLNETVCIQSEYGGYVPCLFKGFLSEDKCILEPKEEHRDENVITELIGNIFKADDVIRLLENQIMECHAMIDHFIKLNNKEEIAFWRKYLQKAKMDKRRLKDT